MTTGSSTLKQHAAKSAASTHATAAMAERGAEPDVKASDKIADLRKAFENGEYPYKGNCKKGHTRKKRPRFRPSF